VVGQPADVRPLEAPQLVALHIHVVDAKLGRVHDVVIADRTATDTAAASGEVALLVVKFEVVSVLVSAVVNVAEDEWSLAVHL
jgi:hypothetical protein